MMWKGNSEIFRTYLKGGGSDGKRCVDKHKGIDFVRNFENASQFASFGGVLNSGWVDVSFDDPEMSDAFLDMADQLQWKCLVLENSDNHHIHTYWKDTQHRITKYGKDISLACGMKADIHGGDTYIPLRCKGSDRFPPVYDKLDDENYQDLPSALYPVNTNITLWNAEEGDGRNDDLYKYILVLQSQLQMEEDDIRDLYRTIINPYILKQPLDDGELDTVLRDESFKKDLIPSFYDGNVFKFAEFSKFLKETCHLVRIHGQLHIYKNGIYESAQRDIESAMIRYVPNLRKSQRREVMDYVNLITDEKPESHANYIAFRNGIYDLVDGSLHEFTPDIVVTNKIPWDYVPDAYDEAADKALDRLAVSDQQVRDVLEECIGACMYRDARLGGGKAFILTGEKSNGKSTFLDMLKNMLGRDNVASLDIKEIGDRFSTSMIAGKLANIGDDIADDFLQGSQVAIFKKVVTGNRIKAEMKGQDPFEFDPYCKLIFSANDIPRMKDKTGAVMRRLVIIPFNATFTKETPGYDVDIIEKLTAPAAMQYLICCGIKGLQRVRVEQAYTICTKVQEQLDEYELENNPIIGFIDDAGIDTIIHEPTADVYRRYQIYCQQAALQASSRPVFTKQINKRLHLQVIQKRINGKISRIFEKG